MTSILLSSVGFCAHYSRQGDWAFDTAFKIVQERNLQLNVFHFLADPFDPEDKPPKGLSREELNEIAIEKERYLRFYYDERLGDHLKAGFRVCEDNEWTELHRCLIRREYQLMVLPYLDKNATFGGRPIEQFVHEFVAPVILVGPNNPDEILMNQPAKMLIDQLGFMNKSWRVLDDTEPNAMADVSI